MSNIIPIKTAAGKKASWKRDKTITRKLMVMVYQAIYSMTRHGWMPMEREAHLKNKAEVAIHRHAAFGAMLLSKEAKNLMPIDHRLMVEHYDKLSKEWTTIMNIANRDY